MISEKNSPWSSGSRTPMAFVREVVRVRAAPFGQKSSRDAASRTRRRVSSLTRALSLITRETVAMETPDARATSRMVVTIDS
jgi:hypothetical protein